MLSVLITSYKEEKTIGKLIKSIFDPSFSGIPSDAELITVIPDEPTYHAAKDVIQELKIKKWTHITDPKKGKPHALNLGLAAAKGDILLLTDGDVLFEKNAVAEMLAAFNSPQVGGVTGRPVSADSKKSFMGYIGHLLADAAHHKRLISLSGQTSGRSSRIVSSIPNFFVMSGYILAMRNLGLRVPEDCLIDDAYLSYEIHNRDLEIHYAPNALVLVKYATSISDWYKQKLRSVGGYVQLWKYQVIQKQTKVRNFWMELEYFWFPVKYASSAKELLWSLALYPMRLVLWLRVFYEQRIKKISLDQSWVRVESTK